MADFPQHFLCPISMELMNDPVTISTGVTYDRNNIQKWFRVYNKKTCPATMQTIHTFEITPNHTLKRLIVAWRDSQAYPRPPSSKHGELASILAAIDTTPFKVSCLRKLRVIVVEAGDEELKAEFKRLGGVELLLQIITQISVENLDFMTMGACEEALGILHELQISEGDDDDDEIIQQLMNPSCMQSMAIVLQRGSSDARFFAISTFRRISRSDYRWNDVAQDVCVGFFKSLLETTSDEICARASSSALQLTAEVLHASKKSRLRAIEAGAICTMIELLPETKSRSRCERIMEVIKLLCECADGRLAFVEHGLGIAAVSKKLMNVSIGATRTGVKIMWLILSFLPTDKVLEEMVVCGAVKKLAAVMQIGGGGGGGLTSTRGRVVRILKLHGGTWRRYPCFPTELKNDYC